LTTTPPPLNALAFRSDAVQHLRRLSERRVARQEEARFVVEGAKLLGEALRMGAAIDAVFVDPEGAGLAELELAATCGRAGARVREVQPGVLRRVCDAVTPQPLAAIVRAVDVPLQQVGPAPTGLVVVCAQVRDPGNLGAIIRNAGAAGAAAVVCCAGSVDLYNPKTVRASAGVLFHIPVVAGPDALEVLTQLGAWGLRRWGASPRAERVYTDVDLAEPAALVLGNESSGLSDPVVGCLDATLRIPMAGTVESLNVASTAAVVCFEAARQRAGRAAAGSGAGRAAAGSRA
jgi:RNA methyltransferase, TrmH family